MSREAHVRFCESAAVKSRRATRPPAESFFHTLKTELTHHQRYATRDQAQQAIFEYIEVFYNRRRKHSTLGYQSPHAFESMHRKAA